MRWFRERGIERMADHQEYIIHNKRPIEKPAKPIIILKEEEKKEEDL